MSSFIFAKLILPDLLLSGYTCSTTRKEADKMAETKNLCAQIDLALHTKVCEEKEKAGQTTSQYIAQLLEYAA